MPHCIVEYSKELERSVKPSAFIEAVHQGALQTDLFEESDIKTRTLSFENHQTGGRTLCFVHVIVKILSGRSREQRAGLSKKILDELKKLNLSSISMTVEICEIERETYAKVLA